MPTYIDRLTPSAVANAKPRTKPYKLVDGRGLFLLVTPNGSKGWRWKYRRPATGKENLLSLGTFPEVTLSSARKKLAKAREMLANGIDPSTEKTRRKAEERRESNSAFNLVAATWLERKRSGWADETYRKASYIIKKYLNPVIGDESVTTLTRAHAIKALLVMPPSLARKARDCLNGVMLQAMDEGFREDGRMLNLRGALPKAEKGHMPAAVDIGQMRKVVKVIWDYPHPITRAALKIQLMTGQRPGNVVSMEWNELDLDTAEWSIPAAKMKTRIPHVAPLAHQSVQLIREMEVHTKGKRYVFPPLAQQQNEHLHRDTLSRTLRANGLKGLHVPHGGRASLRTMGRERLRLDSEVLDAQLAHAKKDDVQKAYVRTGLLDERRGAAQQWADYLESLLNENKVVPIRRA